MDDIIKRYIDKVLEIQDNKHSLTDNDLREIARDLGLSESDLQAIDKDVDNSVQRAEGFIKHSIWNEAISEWKQVLVLSPNRKNARAKLAYCYMHQGDYVQARAFADSALVREPSNALAFDVLAAIRQTTPKKSASSIYAVAAGIVILVIVLGIGSAIVIVGNNSEFLSPWGTAGRALSDSILEDQTQSSGPITRQKIAPQKRAQIAPKNTVGFPIELDLPPNLRFVTHLSKYDVYKDKSFYKLIGKIENGTDLEISELQGTLTYHLKDGNTVQDVIDIHAKHRAALRPGDSANFQELQKISNTTLDSVTLKVVILSSSRASRYYPKSKEIALKWAEGIPSTRYKIAVSERHRSLGAKSSFGQFHKATWEFKNLGQTIRKLKIGVRYFSKENEELAKKFVYLTSSGATPITQKEMRVANMIAKLPAGKFHHYELSVIEIE